MSREPDATQNPDGRLDDAHVGAHVGAQFKADLDVTANRLRAARPTVEASLRDRLLFEAGRAAGERGLARRTTAWATAACLFAATTIGLLAIRPEGHPLPIADRDESRPKITEEPTELVRRPIPAASRVPPEDEGTRLLRAADRHLDAIPSTLHEPLAAIPFDPRPPLTPVRGWRDLDSI